MTIYILSNPINLLPTNSISNELATMGHRVLLCYRENPGFEYSVNAAMNSDLIICIGRSDSDMALQLGIAYASGIEILGFSPLPVLDGLAVFSNLARKVVGMWFTDQEDLVDYIKKHYVEKSFGATVE